MSEQTPASFLPERFRVLSGSALKMIAIITMLIDHTAVVLLSQYAPACRTIFFIGDKGFSFYRICRDIGRVAFPIFCFLLVEGFLHTRNRFKYGRNLLLFALISEIPWNFMFAGTWRCEKQNVFFTLFLGYAAFCAIEHFRESQWMQLLCVLALLLVSVYLNADYGWRGYVFLLIMYWFRYYKTAQAVIGSCWLYYEWKACFAFLSINMYNGKRGFIRGKAAKYFFYAFYPLHITILVILRRVLFP
ncbi:MAG: TraX family protein [Eubacteriales bacterium]|nr:TraX family protein [Eubacteriales bacterium]